MTCNISPTFNDDVSDADQCRLVIQGFLGIFRMFESLFCSAWESANDGSTAAAEVFKGVCKSLSVSVSLI